MDLGVRDKVAMVAASSKGLGYGIAQALAADGAHVSMCSRTPEDIHAAAKELNEETGAHTLATACDVTKPEDITNWVERTVEQWGKVDMLVVNAGGPPAAFFKETTDEQWYIALELTLKSSVRMIRAVIPHMGPGSAILSITSSSVKEPISRLGLSTVMRCGVVGLIETLGDELAPDGIRINNLIPGRIDTDRVAQLDNGRAALLDKTYDEIREQFENAVPLKRYGTIEEFGRAGAFLLSPAASYITGTSLVVDGGTMHSM